MKMTDDVRNIMLNLSGGLMPKDLSKEEVDTLKTEIGDDWFWRLGYSEKIYERPEFDNG